MGSTARSKTTRSPLEQGLGHKTTSLYISVGLFSTTGKPDILNLSNALEGVTDWFMLGFNLGIPPYILRKIEKDYQGNDRRKTETLDTWLQRTPSASWSDVVSALRQMGENFTADSVDQQYIGGVASKLMYTHINFEDAYMLLAHNSSYLYIMY